MKIPIFPLNGAIMFPGTNLPLNIFEERYIEMIDYALSQKRLVGMIQTNDKNEFFKIGCLGKITNFSETADGRYQINLEGIDRFKLNKVINSDHKFIIIEGQTVSFEKNFSKNTNSNEKMLSVFEKFLKEKKINFDTKSLESLDPTSLAKIICVVSPLDHLVKQMLLEFNNEKDLFENLLSVLEIEMKDNNINLKVN